MYGVTIQAVIRVLFGDVKDAIADLACLRSGCAGVYSSEDIRKFVAESHPNVSRSCVSHKDGLWRNEMNGPLNRTELNFFR